MIDEQSSASGHDYASDRSAIGAGDRTGGISGPLADQQARWDEVTDAPAHMACTHVLLRVRQSVQPGHSKLKILRTNQ